MKGEVKLERNPRRTERTIVSFHSPICVQMKSHSKIMTEIFGLNNLNLKKFRFCSAYFSRCFSVLRQFHFGIIFMAIRTRYLLFTTHYPTRTCII